MAVNVLNKERNNNNVKNEPSPGFTLRATIDCDRDEIYVFSVHYYFVDILILCNSSLTFV